MDFTTGFKLLKDLELWKTPSKQEIAGMKERVAALKRSYEAVKNLGFKGSYTSFAKKIGAAHKPTYTFKGFGGGLNDLADGAKKLKTGIDVGKKLSTTLFPQTKQTFKDYDSGKIFKGITDK